MDKYPNFDALAAGEVRGRDYRVRSQVRKGSEWAVLAPHGGGIEPGTSEIAQAVAGKNHSFYAFEGIKQRRNADLHITSARFDEPTGVAIAAGVNRVVTIHGEDSIRCVVFLGGRDTVARQRLQTILEQSGFVIERHQNRNLDGVAMSNICNRCQTTAGIQIELSHGLRRSCFRSLSRNGRAVRTEVFRQLVNAIRRGLRQRER